MNDIMTIGQNLTMTSREIADLVGKEHFHVMRDIRALSDQLGAMFVGYIQDWMHPQNGQSYEEFCLDKDTTLTLLLGYNAVARMRVVKRWQELEAAQAPQIPKTYAEALRLAADQSEQIAEQQAQLALAAPKVEFVKRYVESEGLKGFREVAKLLKANEAEFKQFMFDSRIMYRLHGRLTAYQNHADAGRFSVTTNVATNGHSYTESRFTPKGVAWIAGEWGKHQAAKELSK